jgi:hypothetical protein
MGEIIEHCGQIGGRFEMPYAAGARLITTRGHSGWRTRRPARNPDLGSLETSISSSSHYFRARPAIRHRSPDAVEFVKSNAPEQTGEPAGEANQFAPAAGRA